MSVHYVHYKQSTIHLIRDYLPIVDRLDRFQSFLLLNMVLFALCWLVGKIRDTNIREVFSFSNIKTSLFRFGVKHIWFIRNRFKAEIATIAPLIYSNFPKENRSSILDIPNRKPNNTNINDYSEEKSIRGYLSGSRYPPKNHSDLVSQLSSRFIYSNPLHFNIHPCVRQMEIEVIKMCSKMLNFSDNGQPIGAFLSGGTESIMMAILSYRQYGRAKGISKPNLVICYTGHVASIKSCKYLDIETRFVDYDSEYCMSFSDTKSKIDDNTIGVYTSCPNYPYGTIDPIAEITAYCKKRDIPVHIDMCLGGFLVPFLKNEKGQPLFTIPEGTTSISMDPHKFGLSGKGASILLYSSAQMRSYQFFSTSYWPGGLYGTVGIAGSRSGSGIASSWISMMKMGKSGYVESAQKVQGAVRKLRAALKQMGFKLYGNADICTIAFSHPQLPCGSIQAMLKKKDWGLSVVQKPILLHFSFTPLNSTKADQLIKDIKDSLEELKKSSGVLKESMEVQLYCACARIPDTASKGQIFRQILSAYIDI